MKTSAASRLFACPRCGNMLDSRPRVVSTSGEFIDGQLDCPACDVAVARVTRAQVDFHVEPFARATPAEPRIRSDLAERSVLFDDSAITTDGTGWRPHEGRYLLADPAGSQTLAYQGVFTGVAVDLLQHPWSGRVEVLVDGTSTGVIDLYRPSGSTIERFFIVDDLPLGLHTIVLRPTGTADPSSHGSQVFFREFTLYASVGEPGFTQRTRSVQDANDYGERIAELISAVPDDEWILDCGGGDRIFGRENMINFEYVYNKRANVFGDIHHTPFAKEQFGLIISQAVFEHLSNPFVAARNLIDMLRPGGLVYIEVAFMQPLHAVPYHFFNMTDWGLQELFKTCETVESGWFGPLSGTIDWLFRSVGIDHKLGEVEYAALRERIQSLDALVSHDELRAVASGMFLLARKPLAIAV